MFWVNVALLQVMSCDQLGARPLSEANWLIVIWTIKNKSLCHLN